jgi:hypothetical protein
MWPPGYARTSGAAETVCDRWYGHRGFHRGNSVRTKPQNNSGKVSTHGAEVNKGARALNLGLVTRASASGAREELEHALGNVPCWWPWLCRTAVVDDRPRGEEERVRECMHELVQCALIARVGACVRVDVVCDT